MWERPQWQLGQQSNRSQLQFLPMRLTCPQPLTMPSSPSSRERSHHFFSNHYDLAPSANPPPPAPRLRRGRPGRWPAGGTRAPPSRRWRPGSPAGSSTRRGPRARPRPTPRSPRQARGVARCVVGRGGVRGCTPVSLRLRLVLMPGNLPALTWRSHKQVGLRLHPKPSHTGPQIDVHLQMQPGDPRARTLANPALPAENGGRF